MSKTTTARGRKISQVQAIILRYVRAEGCEALESRVFVWTALTDVVKEAEKLVKAGMLDRYTTVSGQVWLATTQLGSASLRKYEAETATLRAA